MQPEICTKMFKTTQSFVHHFDMYSWENINAQFVSLEPWDDGLLTRLVGKREATYEVIFRPLA